MSLGASALLLSVAWATSAAQLSLPARSASPGSALLVPVSFTSVSQPVAGLQFELQYDPTAFRLSITLGDAPRTAAKSVYLWQVYPGLMRIFLFGLNQSPMPTGDLVDLIVNIAPDALPAAYPLQLMNIIASDPSGQPLLTTETDGSITVQADAGGALLLQGWGVLNGASLVPGPVAPGEIVTLIGSGIGPATVSFDGVPAPVLYNGSDQINLISPYAIAGKETVTLKVVQGGSTVAELPMPVTSASPAIFTLDGSGSGQGAILNRDYTLNGPSNAAAKGSVVMIFATGAGQTDPLGVDGQIAGDALPHPVQSVSVLVGGVPAEVLYAGAAPGLVAGMLQVNCLIPAAAPSGWTIPVTLTIGTAVSPAGVTLAIQ